MAHDEVDDLYQALMSHIDSRRQVAHSYVYQVGLSYGSEWFDWVKATLRVRADGWTAAHRAAFLSVLPATQQVWALAEELGEETDCEYWQRILAYSLPERGEACMYAVRKLLKHGRPFTAIDLLDLYADEIPTGPPDDVVAEALEQAASTPLPANLNSTFSNHVGRHLDRLEKNGFEEQRLATLEWIYLPLFRYTKRRSGVLHRALASDPAFFVQVVSLAYRAKDEEPKELSAEELSRSRIAHTLLGSWRLVPGSKDDGTIDEDILRDWISKARELLSNCRRIKIGDQCIGQVLRYGPAPEEDRWPAEPIRDVIEEVASEDLEKGFQVEVYNSRGITSRGLTDGGQQERALAQMYRRYASFASITWPRTAAMLIRIAESYEREARRHDIDADLQEDLWR